MSWHKDSRYSRGGYWDCAPKHRARMLRRYYGLSNLDYNYLLMRNRHDQAMLRRRNREAARGTLP